MNKIISGMLSIAMALTLVAGSAYALVTSHVTATGITLGVATAGLQLKVDGGVKIDADQSVDVASLGIGTVTLVPGEEYNADFSLNNSGDVDLALSGKSTPTAGDAALNDLIWVRFVNQDTDEDSGWAKLSAWNASKSFNSTLAAGQEDAYKIYYKLDSAAGEDVEGSTITLNFTINGDQVTP